MRMAHFWNILFFELFKCILIIGLTQYGAYLVELHETPITFKAKLNVTFSTEHMFSLSRLKTILESIRIFSHC